MWSFAASTIASCCRWSWISWCCPYLAASRTSAASTVESRVGWSDQWFIRMLQDSPCSRTVDASSCRSCVLRVRPGSCQHTVTTVGLLRNICFNCDDKCLGQSTDQAVCQASAWPTCYMLPVSTGHQSYWSVNTDHASRFITGKWLYICTFFTVTFCPEVTAVSCWNPNMSHFFCIVFCFSSWYCNWFSHIHSLSSAIFQFLWVDHIFLSPAVSIYLYSVHPFWLCTHTHLFNDPLSGTTRVSRYQNGKTNLHFTEERDSEWQWHQLGHMQVCTLLQTGNHANNPPLKFFYRPDALPTAQPTISKHWRHPFWLMQDFLYCSVLYQPAASLLSHSQH